MLIDMGFDILEISERLGHESVKTTLDTYSHLYPEKDTKLAGELNKLRRPDTSERVQIIFIGIYRIDSTAYNRTKVYNERRLR